MSTKTTLILLALLILVAGVVYFIEYRNPAGGAATPAPSGASALLDVTTPAISGITVRDVVSDTQVSATRDMSGTWWLTSQLGKMADPSAFNSMASRLSSIYVQRVLTPTGSLSEYGLVTPTLSVQVGTTSGMLEFNVGDATPSKGAYYAQKPGDARVYLIDAGLVGDLRNLATNPPVTVPPTSTPEPSILPTPTPASP